MTLKQFIKKTGLFPGKIIPNSNPELTELVIIKDGDLMSALEEAEFFIDRSGAIIEFHHFDKIAEVNYKSPKKLLNYGSIGTV